MTDEVTPQAPPGPKKDEKKPPSSASNRGSKRNPSSSGRPAGTASSAQGAPRPSSRTGNKKPSTSAPAPESGSDTTSRKGSDTGRKPDQRNKNQNNGSGRQPAHRKGQASASQGGRNNNNNNNAPRDQGSAKQSSSPAPTQGKESSDALSSLQRVIADLKSTSPQPNANNNFSMPTPQIHSNLPVNAPVFQPGAAAYPGTSAGAADAKHRKAASVGAALSGNFNSFAPHLGSMNEDAEDAGASFEEGEIPDNYYQQGHQARAQSQSFMAPRFAALAAQQEQGDAVGPTGRPQLAPNFMFGAGAGNRKRGGPMGPPINEEDVNFQFPQQQQQHNFPSDGPTESRHRKSESAEITGIMAEQVLERSFHVLTPANRILYLDRVAEPDRGSAAAAASSLPAATGFQPSHVLPNPGTGA